MIIALSLAAALDVATVNVAAQEPVAPEVRREVRIVTADGSGPGAPGTPGGFARLDRNGDGFISRDEYVGPASEAFGVLDKNNDGRVSPGELADGRAVARTILSGGAGGPMVIGGPGGVPGGASGRMGGGPRALFIGGHGDPDAGPGEHEVTVIAGGPGGGEGPMRFVMRRPGGPGAPGGAEVSGPGNLDRDGDGKVSEEEFLAPLRDAFRRMDKDSSGALEAGEHGPGSGANVHVVTRRIERPAGD